MYIALSMCGTMVISEVPYVPRYKPLQKIEMARANLQSAAALYVPLLHYPVKTAA
jgi:hypothetical protein